MRQRVFFKLLAAMVLVVLAAAAMLAISQQTILKSSLQNQRVGSLSESAQALAQHVVSTPAANLVSLAQEEALAIDARVTILDRDGRVIADCAASGVGTGRSAAASISMNSSEMRAVTVQHRPFGKAVHQGTLFVTAAAGSYIVRLGYPLRDVYQTLHMVRRSLLWATLLGLLLAIVLAGLLAHAVSRRLARIIDFAHRLAGGDFGARIVDSGEDEIAAVANALDATAANVEAVFRTLQDSRKEMETVLDSMEEAVIAVDAQSRVHWSNRVMERLMGGAVRPGNALVQTMRDPDLLACVEKALSRRTTAHVRARTVLPGRIFDVSAAPMLGGSAVVVLHDVTEIDRVEKTRRDFIANVSHELRTPLTSISGYAETMLEEGDGMPAQARDFLSIICRNAARMTRLTDDLLALARIESGEYKLNRQPVEAELLIDEAAAILAGLLMDRNVVLEKGESTREKVMADTDSIVQVLSNLLENAVKYGAGERVVVGARHLAGAVEFYVQDFGAGIASEHLTRIFERFYRVDKARSRESGGTGLGLSIAKHIILAHEGTIRAESELNRGSTFFFTLPAVPATHLEEEPEENIAMN
jgi:two-component system, OmpR family, phosphate regulon sensor histidine kinase PhoR